MDLWAKNLEEAKEIQGFLTKIVSLHTPVKKISYVCGLDASYSPDYVYACASVFKFPELIHIEDSISKIGLEFPYIPGFLSFREGKALLSAINHLKVKPDVLIIDGHGIAHPKSCGIATHVGIAAGISSIGCAKSCLIGKYNSPSKNRGSFTYLYLEEKKVGLVLRTKDNTRPLFVSPGYMIDLYCSLDIVLKCTGNYRTPEPLRRAHMYSKQARDLSFKKT
ncbi:MAG: endonuclease V [Deltaproteobacteria bacterium]|nr:endonuclease V [Deltaproteobacteria bacterium]